MSVPLPVDLRERLAVEARKRGLKMATAARVFLDEHMAMLEDAEQLSQAEEWQRVQAWATWDRIKAGEAEDVPLERFDEHTARALERLDGKIKAS